jgi:iron complex transport system substrate-binding protein
VPEIFNEVMGTGVRIPDEPKRIVSFSPAATETLFSLGLGPSVVGVSAFCARPREATLKRRVGSYNTVRRELLEELDPDLVLTVTGYQREFALGLSGLFPVYPLELPVSVAGIVDFVVKVGLVSGAPDEGRDLSRRLLRDLGRFRGIHGIRAYVELDLGGPVSFGAHSYITDAIHLLGCSTLFERERREWLSPDMKAVAEGDPDVVFYEPKMYAEFREADRDSLIAERGWRTLRAVTLGNFFVTPRPLDFLAHHGPSFVTEAMPWLEDSLVRAEEKIGR